MAAPGEVRAVPSKTELRCKLCAHSHRTQIDDLLLKRSTRQLDEHTGQAINEVYVLAALAGFGVQNPTPDNIKNHWRKHVTVIGADVVEKQEEAREVALLDDSPVNVDSVLDRIVKLGQSDLEVLLQATGKSGITVDQTLKALTLKSQRKQDEAARKLIGGIAGAIGGALAKKMLSPAPTVKHLNAETGEVGEIIDAEVVV